MPCGPQEITLDAATKTLYAAARNCSTHAALVIPINTTTNFAGTSFTASGDSGDGYGLAFDPNNSDLYLTDYKTDQMWVPSTSGSLVAGPISSFRRRRARAEHAIAHLKEWAVLKDCRRRNDAITTIARGVGALHNLRVEVPAA